MLPNSPIRNEVRLLVTNACTGIGHRVHQIGKSSMYFYGSSPIGVLGARYVQEYNKYKCKHGHTNAAVEPFKGHRRITTYP